MSQRTRRLLIQIGSFVLAGVLLYLALLGIDLSDVGRALQEANYGWLLPFAAVALLSHLLRAWRWIGMLEVLPIEDGPAGKPKRATLEASFSSTMIGYMVNYVAPRFGELARTANLSMRTRHRFSGVLGTVAVERVLDTAVLFLILLTAIPPLMGQLGVLQEQFLDPAQAQVAEISWTAVALMLLACLAGAVIAVLWFRRMLRYEDSMLASLWSEHVRPALASFRDGFTTLWRSSRWGLIAGTTVGMWICYALMAYLPFYMLDMVARYGLTLTDAWVLMAIGVLGLVVPSPGGIGSYHYVTIQALVYLYGVAEAPAASYAVLSHGLQMILYIMVGGLCLLWQGITLRQLREASEAADESAT